MDLPRELQDIIWAQLSREDKLRLRLVSKSFQSIADAAFFIAPICLLDNNTPKMLHSFIANFGGFAYIRCTAELTHSYFHAMGVYELGREGRIDNAAIIRKIDLETGVVDGFVKRPIWDTSGSSHPWLYDKYQDCPQKLVWVRMRMKPDYSRPLAIYDQTNFRAETRLQFYRAGWDSVCRDAWPYHPVRFPVWVCNSLPIKRSINAGLLQQILERDVRLADVQPSGVVHDIICPDLYTCPIPGGSYWSRRLADHQFYEQHGSHFRRGYDQTLLPADGELRERYHWVPVDVAISHNGNAKFISPIPGLGHDEQDLAKNLEVVFQELVPLFQLLDEFIPTRKECTRQVVIKIQSYIIPPRTAYTGRWHTEGVTENIMAVGVYYVDVAVELEGGELEFKWHSSPTDHYFKPYSDKPGILCDPAPAVQVPVKTGKAFVFSNQIPHRFLKTINSTDRPRRRTFINFFMIDPLRPLPSSRTVSPLTWESVPIEERKQIRGRVRNYMATKVTGWGYLDHGNSGTVEFYDDTKTTKKGVENDDEQHLPRTRSELSSLFD